MVTYYPELEANITRTTGKDVTSANLTTFLDETTDTFHSMFPILGCIWIGKDANTTCSEQWFTEIYSLYTGKCFSFNYKKSVRNFYQVQSGSSSGLYLFLNVNHSEYTGILVKLCHKQNHYYGNEELLTFFYSVKR